MNSKDFSENGIPEVIISDGGPQFRSKFRNFAQEWGFQHIQSSPYHHQSNGEAERFVRTVKDILTKAHQSGQDPDMALLCYRSTPINSKPPSPVELMNSRRHRTLLPTRTMLKSREERGVNEFKTKAGTVLQQISTNITRTQCKYMCMFNCNHILETGNQQL